MSTAEDPRRNRALSGVTRIAVLDALTAAAEPLTVQEIAEQLGLHANTVRFHLNQLIRAELVREDRADPIGPGRPRMVYRRTPAAGGGPEHGYQLLAEILAGHLAGTSAEPDAVAVAAGREWGRHLTDRPEPFTRVSAGEAVERLTDFLDRLGFDPAPEPGGRRILLRTCPFRTVADRRPEVVCSIHLGLMRGALAEMGAPVEVVDLTRSPAPEPCVTTLRPTG